MSREQINDIFKKTGAEAIFITDPHNMWYLSGFRGGKGMLYISPKRKVLITNSRYLEAARRETDYEIIQEDNSHKKVRILTECLAADNAHIVGYEDKHMRCHDFSKLQNSIDRIEQWLPLDDQILEIRQVKSPEEIAKIERAEKIACDAFRQLMLIMKAGMTELDAAAELEYQMRCHGATGLSFETVVASGANTSMPHVTPTMKKIEKGELVILDFGCVYDGYCSDLTRTVVLGKANEEQKALYSVVQAAHDAALAGIRSGITAKEADQLARDVISRAGYGKNFLHSLGHGLGLYINEKPKLSQKDHTILEPGMVESVEPGIYIPGRMGVRVEDVVVVEENGIRNLTDIPAELIEL